MPVQRATISAMSSAVTSSLRNPSFAVRARLGLRELALELGDRAVAQLGGALEVGLALGALDVAMGDVEALLEV